MYTYFQTHDYVGPTADTKQCDIWQGKTVSPNFRVAVIMSGSFRVSIVVRIHTGVQPTSFR